MAILRFILLSLGGFNIDLDTVDDCDNIEVKAKIIETNFREVTFEVTGGVSPYEYIVYKEDQKIINRKKTKSNKILLNQSGKYYCTVIDSSGCMKRIEFDIAN